MHESKSLKSIEIEDLSTAKVNSEFHGSELSEISNFPS